MSDSSRTLASPFLSAPGRFPTAEMLEGFEAGMFLLHEAVNQLRDLSSAGTPNTRRLDISTEALRRAMRSEPVSPVSHETQKWGGAGYLSDQKSVLSDLVTTLEGSEQDCRVALTNLCHRLDALFYDDIASMIEAADEMIKPYFDVGESALWAGRAIVHQAVSTPLGNILNLIDAAQDLLVGVSDLLDAAKDWSAAMNRFDKVRLLADQTSGNYEYRELDQE